MPEHSDYEPAPWARDSFASARATYDTHVGRSYADAVKKDLKAGDLLPEKLTTDASAPIVFLIDDTGSMGDWPATIFSKLPYVDHEAQFYFGKDNYAIAFGAFNDAHAGARYPVQMRPFAKEAELGDRLKELVIQSGGGGQMHESSELGALYVDQNIEIPNAVRPVLVLITDEKPWPTVSQDQAKDWCRVDLKERLTTEQLFENLKQKWSVYVILKPYEAASGNVEPEANRQVRQTWEKLVGEDHVAPLPEASRVVDVIFGIFAKETGKVDEFRQELKDRQLKDKDGQKKVNTALKALISIHKDADENAKTAKKLAAPNSKKSDQSVTRRDPGTTTRRSKSLLDD